MAICVRRRARAAQLLAMPSTSGDHWTVSTDPAVLAAERGPLPFMIYAEPPPAVGLPAYAMDMAPSVGQPASASAAMEMANTHYGVPVSQYSSSLVLAAFADGSAPADSEHRTVARPLQAVAGAMPIPVAQVVVPPSVGVPAAPQYSAIRPPLLSAELAPQYHTLPDGKV